jgi:zinc/manganese transport system substrate-binding protein
MKHLFWFVAAFIVWQFSSSPAPAEERLKIATTLSSYADIAKAVGGDAVDVVYVAPLRFDPHFIEPRPSDVFKLKKADLFIHSGLDLEAWREPLTDAAGRAEVRWGGERQLDLSARISLLEVPTHQLSRAEGDIHMYGNPHYWLDPRNGIIIAEEITAKLSQIDPLRAASYQNRLQSFVSKLRPKIQEWQALLRPYQGRELVGYHKGWMYLMTFAGLKMNLSWSLSRECRLLRGILRW